MHLLLIGCEYAGKKTLAVGISRWMMAAMALPFVRWHDHYVVPRLDGTWSYAARVKRRCPASRPAT